ncbi:MAG: flavodoxin family protein, partial [Desulfotomaculales bacterium]
MGVEMLGICGSPVKDGNTTAYLEAVTASLKEPGMRVNIINVARLDIADCLHCNFCVTEQTKEKICSFADDMAEIYPQVLKADVLVFASPVYLM